MNNTTSLIYLKRQYQGKFYYLMLFKTLDILRICSDFGFSVGLIDEDLYKWNICIFGQPDTLYEVCRYFNS